MFHASKAEIIRALFAAYLSNDRAGIEDSFTDDFRFTSPYDDRIDNATYFERRPAGGPTILGCRSVKSGMPGRPVPLTPPPAGSD